MLPIFILLAGLYTFVITEFTGCNPAGTGNHYLNQDSHAPYTSTWGSRIEKYED